MIVHSPRFVVVQEPTGPSLMPEVVAAHGLTHWRCLDGGRVEFQASRAKTAAVRADPRFSLAAVEVP